jgi:hypothetical protein
MECGCPSPEALATEVSMKALKEALNERVRKKMEAGMGKKLDRLADLIVEGMGAHMEMHKVMGQKMEYMQKKQEWAQKLMAAMNED